MADCLISVVVVTPFRFSHLRRAVRHLRAQSIVERIELILVCTTESALDDVRPGEFDPFGRVVRVAVGPIESADQAAAQGMMKASADVVAYLDDHAYASPGWAEAHVEAHRGPWAIVASLMCNANPDRMWSWVNLLGSFGWWAEGATEGEQLNVPGHNVSFKRAILGAEGAALPERLERESGFIEDLKRRGERLFLSEKAAVAHVNASTLRATWLVRYNSGRRYGFRRAQMEGWGWARRLLFIGGSPLIPLVRLARLRREWFGNGLRANLVPAIYPALSAALVFDAMGQMMGYAFGQGRALDVLHDYETHLRTHVTPREALLMEE